MYSINLVNLNRLLHFHDVEVMDKAAAEEPIPVPTKDNKIEKEQVIKKKKKSKGHSDNEPPILEPQVEVIISYVLTFLFELFFIV